VAILGVTLSPVSGPNDVQLLPWTQPNTFNAVGNVILFAPFGGALALLGRRHLAATLAGLALSAAIETIQLAIPGRTTSTADVVWNTLGAALGWALVARR
jgi:glycopeptide antibiotics resistance protein